MTTTIQVSDEQWKILNSLKDSPKDTFIVIIDKLLKNHKKVKKEDE